jgi:hydroxymethylpyrimidine pyrophosphatase-like HAD family hydrolase
LRTTRFQGIVFDYDETLCPSSNRFGSLPPDVSNALTNIVEHGVTLGIASGRGRSVGHAMRESLDRRVWGKVLVGYYNGGCVLRLSEGDPSNTGEMAPALANFYSLLQKHQLLPEMCDLEPRPHQITLTPRGNDSAASVLELILELAAVNGTPSISVTRSSHSIDVLGPGVSKLSVVEACHDQIVENREEANVLRVGDSGTWNGNDLQLLSTPLSLSVADCPMNPSWAWNLAAPGHRGPEAALDYINAMQFSRGSFSLDIDRLVGRMS